MPLTIAELRAAVAKYERAPQTARNRKALARNRELLAGRLADEGDTMTDAAHLSKDDYVEIAKRYSAHLLGRGSVEVVEWPGILGPELFKKAVEGGYFGPIGTVPGFPYGDLKVKGAQVSGTSDGDPRGILYTLTFNSEVIAEEYGDGTFDTVAFAERHGYHI